uniref:heme-binding protein n=1 Tax=Neorhizobium sp. EC2-8 TaxID=3129230 RepID=UPI003101941B
MERYILSPDDYVSSGGSVPLIVRGSGCVDSVTVSGLTQYDDHRLAADAIRHVLGQSQEGRPRCG